MMKDTNSVFYRDPCELSQANLEVFAASNYFKDHPNIPPSKTFLKDEAGGEVIRVLEVLRAKT